ncbi:MAG: hypothetical protein AAGL97_09750 [Pseudomonadota bacterium]
MGEAERKIRELAAEWMVGSRRQKIDRYTDAVNRLHGDGLPADEIEMLVINMRRTDYPDGIELTRLHAAYLEEKA